MIYYTVFAILLCGSLQSSSAFPIDPTKAVQAGIGFITDVIGGKNFQEAASARGIEAADAIAMGDMARIAAQGAKEVENGASVNDVAEKMSKQLLNTYAEKFGLQTAVDMVGREKLEKSLKGGIMAMTRIPEYNTPFDEDGNMKTPMANLQRALIETIGGMISGFSS